MRVRPAEGLVTALFLGLCVNAVPAQGAYLDGQIRVDPSSPARMVYHNTYVGGRLKPAVFCGPGDPEDFFYNDTTQNRDFLISKGARCTYITAYLRDFGGGSPGSGATLDSTLNTWEGLITDLENAGIITVFFFFDDTQPLPSGWETAVDKIVNKFEHHRLLVWSAAEEYSEALSKSQVAAVAARIKAADDRDHVVGVHQLGGASFDFNGYADLEMFLMQLGDNAPGTIHSNVLSAWSDTAGSKILNMSEMANHAEKDRTTVRRVNWASVMGGASAVQILRMGRATDSASWNEQGKYDDCAVLMDFFESTDVNSMTPSDGLAHGGTQWVLADPGQSYIAYAANLTGDIGLKSMTADTYEFKWVDCVTGNVVTQTDVSASAGDRTWPRPGGIGTELAVWIRRTGGGTGNNAPTADPQSVTCFQDQSADITLTGSDPDGDPLTYAITLQPSQGALADDDGDDFVRYTPQAGYTGPDSFRFRVNDGSLDSGEVTVSITVESPGNDAPTAQDKSVTTTEDTQVYVQLVYTDPDGPGPYTVTIVTGVSHGQLTGIGNDRYYTPQTGYTGADSFTWKVSDNLIDSNTATVTITVLPSGAQTIVIECEDMTLTDYDDEGVGYIAVDYGAGKTTGTATASFPGATGRYRVEVVIVKEDDGQPTLELYAGGSLVGTINYALGAAKRDPETVDLGEVDIALGAEIRLVGIMDGGAAARVDKIIFTPVGSSGNSAPTVNLSADPASGDAPLTVSFDAGSSDPDGDTLSHEWDFEYDWSTFTVGAATGATATASHTYDTQGTYTAAVRVDDGNGHVVVDTVTITVSAATDSDGDGLPDAWELQYFGDLGQGRDDDFDGDGASNYKEYVAGTDPTDDTDFPPPSSSDGGGACAPTGAPGVPAAAVALALAFLASVARLARLRSPS